MNTLTLAVILIVAGIILFIIGRRGPKVGSSTMATGGSVAVGGSSSGPITNFNAGSGHGEKHVGHTITVIAIIVEVIGIAVVIWHAFHLARG
jgi:hypothetical protein